MRDILEDLYTGRYTPGFHPSEESHQMRDEYAAMLELLYAPPQQVHP